VHQSSIILRDSIYESAEEPSEIGASGLIFIEYQLFGLQPVFEGMAVLSTMLLILGVGPLRDARMEVLRLFIRLVGTVVCLLVRDSTGVRQARCVALRLIESSWA
jgi:hypothetical protein